MRAVFLSTVMALALCGCVPTDGQVSTQPPQASASGSLDSDYKTLISLELPKVQFTLEEKCGAVRPPYITVDRYSGIGLARRELNKAQQHAKQLPKAKACHQQNVKEAALTRVGQYAQMAELIETYSAKLAAGKYPATSPNLSVFKYVLSKGAPDMDDFEKELGFVAKWLATADEGSARSLRTANQAMRAAQTKNAAMWSKAINGAKNSGAFSIKKEVNAARASANLPPILSEAEKRELRAAHIRAMAQQSTSEKTSVSDEDNRSSNSSGGAMITLTSSYDCPGFYDEKMTKSLCERLTAEEKAKQERLQAEYEAKQRAKYEKEQAEAKAKREADEARARAMDKDHNDCTPPITSPSCKVITQ